MSESAVLIMRMKPYFLLAGIFVLAFACPGAREANAQNTGASAGLKIPVNARFGPANCPVALVGKEVWSMKTGRPTGVVLSGEVGSGDRAAISPDGKLVCALTSTVVKIWSAETGNSLGEIPNNGAQRHGITWAGSEYLLMSGTTREHLEVWDPRKRTLVRKIVSDQYISDENLAVMPNGKYVAVKGRDHVRVFDLATGERVATMERPSFETTTVAPALAHAPGEPPTRETSSGSLGSIRALRFSPDGMELAALGGSLRSQLVVWNNQGKLVFKESYRTGSLGDGQLAWLPDGRGWLLGRRYLVDRGCKRIVAVFSAETAGQFVEKDRVLTQKGNLLEPKSIPFAQIRKGVEAAGGNTPAYIKPGQAISLQLEMGSLRGNADQARNVIVEAMKQRLSEETVEVKDNSPAVLTLKFEESAGSVVPIYEQTRFNRRGTDTGKTMTMARGNLMMTLVARGSNEPLWQKEIKASSSLSYSGEITDATVRTSMLGDVAGSVQQTQVPWFLPVSDEIPALPMLIINGR